MACVGDREGVCSQCLIPCHIVVFAVAVQQEAEGTVLVLCGIGSLYALGYIHIPVGEVVAVVLK